MKKVLVVLLTVFALTACSKETITISNSSEALISGDKVNYSKQEFYDDMKTNDFTGIILASLNERIAKLENIDLSNIETSIDEDINKLKEQYGESYESIVAYYGGIDTLKANLTSAYIGEKLGNNYFENDYETLKTTYMPKKAKLAYFENEESAKAMIEAINSGKTFEMAAAENGYGSTISESVVTDKSELSVEIKKFISETTEPKLSDVIATTTSSTDNSGNTTSVTKYYVVEVTNTDADSFKEEFLTVLNSIVDPSEVYNYYFDKYDIEVYDQATYDLMSAKYKGIK